MDEIRRHHALYIRHLLREPFMEPTRQVTFLGQATPNYRPKARPGGVRLSWTILGMQEYWRIALPQYMRVWEDRTYANSQFDHTREPHRNLIYRMAQSRYGQPLHAN